MSATVVTSQTVFRCCNDQRLSAVRARAGLNGIEAIELVTPPGPLTSLPVELLVTFVKPIDEVPSTAQVVIAGGVRGSALRVASTAPTHDPAVMRVRLDGPGDLSPYELRLVDPASPPRPPAGIDPILAVAPFKFAVVCETDVDCAESLPCEPPFYDEPLIDRLAKDFGTFRKVILDRMSTLMPDWQDRNPADVRIALVELLAYVGDQLSYEQDAVATEAYLGTARRRVSVRRHARLVDYRMHDGLSARSWLQFEIGQVADVADGPRAAAHGTFVTAPLDTATVLDTTTVAGREEMDRIRRRGDIVFHTVADGGDPALGFAPRTFSQLHNRMTFHTWSGERCCLPAGSTSATLTGHLPALSVGDVLVLAASDGSDPDRAHAVRLTSVDAGTSASPLKDPATDEEVTEISWAEQDALAFALTVSTETVDDNGASVLVGDAGVAYGNIVLVEHGEVQPPEALVIPDGAARWRPALATPNVAQVLPMPGPGVSARAIARGAPADAVAAVELRTADGLWLARRDLIGAGNGTRMAVEVDDDGVAWLRFGFAEANGEFLHGRPPLADAAASAEAVATYRVGVGRAGNVAAGAIHRLIDTGDPSTTLDASLLADGVITAIRNPLAAWGGTDPESIEQVRQRAPFAFTVQERAVTAQDYAARAEQFADEDGPAARGGVQRAVAQLRWTGSWYTVFVAVDRFDGLPVDAGFETRLRAYLDRYRMAGHDIEIEAATDVPLEIGLTVRIAPTSFRSTVMTALTAQLSNRRLPDGTLGLFHPDRLSFATTVYLSPIVAVAQAVPGVLEVDVTRFGRFRQPAVELRDAGLITVGRSEIARLDNDPSHPERGTLKITLIGGR